MSSSRIYTPLGSIILCADDSSITECYWDNTATFITSPSPFTEYYGQIIKNYFNGEPFPDNIPLNPTGTEFQCRVWHYLRTIPFGTTMSYRQLSEAMNNKQAIRAIAHANGCNPIALFIPCHRIIGSDGSLTGYAWGLHRKEWLLHHENALVQRQLF